MKSVGEVLALGRTLRRGLRQGDGRRASSTCAPRDRATPPRRCDGSATPSWDRYDVSLGASPRGGSRADVVAATGIDPWFLAELAASPPAGAAVRRPLESLDAAALRARAPGRPHRPRPRRRHRRRRGRRWGRAGARSGVRPTYHAVDTCAAEFAALTPYYYSAFESEGELARDDRPAIVVLGSGPNRIGQGIEFDYCCVHARRDGPRARLRRGDGQLQPGDRLHRPRRQRPPLPRAGDRRRVLDICAAERPVGVITQLGGQTPLRLARALADGGRPGPRDPARVDRPRRGPRPLRARCSTSSACRPRPGRWPTAPRRRSPPRTDVGYPVLVRPSYVLGRPGHGHLRLARRAATPTSSGERARGRPAGRPLPGERDRAGRGRPLRRHATAGPPR